MKQLKYLRVFGNDIKSLTYIFIFSVAINFIGLFTPIFSMLMYDKVIGKGNIETLITLSFGMLIFLFIELTLKIIRSYAIGKVTSLSTVDFENKFINKILSVSYSKIKDSGDVVGKYRDYITIKEYFIIGRVLNIIDIPFLFMFLFFMWYVGGVLALIPLVVFIPFSIVYLISSHKQLYFYSKWKKESFLKYNRLARLISKLPHISLFQGRGLIIDRLDDDIYSSVLSRNKQFFWDSIISAASVMSISMASLILLTVGAIEINNGALSVGGLIACSLMQFKIMSILNSIIPTYTALKDLIIEDEKINTLFEGNIQPNLFSNDLNIPEAGASVSLINISYKNKGLSDINYTIQRGERIALIGRSGAGKSTLLNCIAGVFDEFDGDVLIESKSIKNMSKNLLSKLISYKNQDATFIGENLSDVFSNQDPKRIDIVAELTGLNEYINNGTLNEGDLFVEHGVSSGQRQIISLAQSLVSDVGLYLIDEPTNGLDADAEIKVINAINQLTKGKTVIIATHSKSILKSMDKALVLDDGKVVSILLKENLLNM